MSKSAEEGYNLHNRLLSQIHLLLREMEEQPEEISFKDRLAAIMYLTRDIKIRASDDESRPVAGSAVRKCAGSFRANASRDKRRRAGDTAHSNDDEDDDGTLFGEGGHPA